VTINYIKNAANNSVLVHVSGSNTLVCTGDDVTSNLASSGEVVSRAPIKQVWCGSSSGTGDYWVVERGNDTVNTVVGVYDSSAWIDYAGNGAALTLHDDGENVWFTLVGAGDSYLMLEFKKEIG